LFEQVLAYRRRVLGDGQENTQNAMNHLALTRQAQKRFDEAEALLVELLAIRRREHGESHESVGETLWNLGRHHLLKNDRVASKRYLDEALARSRAAGGEGTAAFACLQARYHALLGQGDEALGALRRCVDLGYSEHLRLVQEADLATLRNDPRFKKIVSDVQRRNESR
jgi:tetratricopeptide (TPR) repeat protein